MLEQQEEPCAVAGGSTTQHLERGRSTSFGEGSPTSIINAQGEGGMARLHGGKAKDWHSCSSGTPRTIRQCYMLVLEELHVFSIPEMLFVCHSQTTSHA